MEIFWSAEALEHLDDIRHHIAQDNPKAAFEVWEYLYEFPQQQLVPSPDQTFPRRGHEGIFPGTLELTNTRYRNYIIVYVLYDDAIEITAVRDARMKPKRKRRR